MDTKNHFFIQHCHEYLNGSKLTNFSNITDCFFCFSGSIGSLPISLLSYSWFTALPNLVFSIDSIMSFPCLI